MDRSVAWRSALLMAAAVAVIAVVLGAALDESFFRSWGWLAGPGVWAACALLVARVLRLPAGWTLLGAALSGLPSLVAVLADVHWAGSPMAFLERLLPEMAARGWGRVLAIGSMAVSEPIDALQLSNAHRPGVVAAFKVLARRYAGDGVTLNFLHPGRIATDRVIGDGTLEEVQAAARDTIPARRLGSPEEIAAAAVFLCSAPASYITGTSMLVDGGLTRSV